MASFGKLGNIVGQTFGKQIKSHASLSNPSICQTTRCLFTKLFVGGLSFNTDLHGLWEAFSKYGQVTKAKVVMDRETGRPSGYGFVTFSNAKEASSAIQAVDQQELHGRTVKVNYAAKRAKVNHAAKRAKRVKLDYAAKRAKRESYKYKNRGSHGGGGGYGTQGYGGKNLAYAPPTQSDVSAGNFSFSGGNNANADPSS